MTRYIITPTGNIPYTAEEEAESKSVETMWDYVNNILDEIIETDSTVTVTFNMTVKNPLMYETKEK